MARPTLLKFWLDDNDDETLTCFFCGTSDCEATFTVRGQGKAQIIGVHHKCVEKHQERHLERAVKGDAEG